MNLLDLIARSAALAPWSGAEKIPWDEPGFSQRMLKEHLSQEHDAASRRFEKIDAHVDWIHCELLSGHSSRILDLGCGPGLYASRLAGLGHECVGIDFSPASIAYAVETANREGLQCTYLHQDIRIAEYGSGFDLAMLIFGEFNAFRPADAESILRKAFEALRDGGTLLLEVHTFDCLKALGEQEPSWYASASGLFSEHPHLHLEEHFWDATACVATTRHFVVDAGTCEVSQYFNNLQAYSDELYCEMVEACGFTKVRFLPALTGKPDQSQSHLFAITARKDRQRKR
jgi:SAM-dependent methyltransferase